SFGDAVSASVSDLEIKIQSNTPPPVVGIDWSAIDSSIDIDATELLLIEGEAALSIAGGVVSGSAHFAVGKSTVTNVDVDGAGSGALLASGVLQKFTLTNFMAASSFGLSVTGSGLTIAALKPTVTTDTRAWSAVYGTGLAGSLSFGDALSATVSEIGRAS